MGVFDMDIQSSLQLLSSIPWWAWAALILVVLSFFGDKKLWEFEVEFAYKEGVGKGEVEIEHYTNRNPLLEVELDLDAHYLNRDLEVVRNGQRVIFIPATSNTRMRLRVHEPYLGEKPVVGDLIEIKCGREAIFSGNLRTD